MKATHALGFALGLMCGAALTVLHDDTASRRLQVIPSAWSVPGCGAEDFKRHGREFVRWTCPVDDAQ